MILDKIELKLQSINVSKKDTLAWRAQGRGRRVLGPESMGEAV